MECIEARGAEGEEHTRGKKEQKEQEEHSTLYTTCCYGNSHVDNDDDEGDEVSANELLIKCKLSSDWSTAKRAR